MNGFFITGTDTNVGKTHVARQIIRLFSGKGFKVSAYKPVASDAYCLNDSLVNQDALSLMAESSVVLPYNDVNPYCFEPAIAPHIAANDAQVEIKLSTIETCFKVHQSIAEWVVVEGAGGWKVPLSDKLGFDDVAQALDLPIVLVVGLRLGCINHALLTEEAILSKGCNIVGWVANNVEPDFDRRDENMQALRRRMKTPCLAVLEHDCALDLTQQEQFFRGLLRR